MAKRYVCWNCGEDMGEWDARYCRSDDTCGKLECNRTAADAAQWEREEAHERLDRDMGYGW